jgi:Concanavalin A-like lectin/glucanases superfamily
MKNKIRVRSILKYVFALSVIFYLFGSMTSVAYSAEYKPIPNEYQKWVNIGPGGGGWFRCAEYSPWLDKLFIGGDVSGILVSDSNYEFFTAKNQGLENTYIQSIHFDANNANTIYLGTRGGVAKSADGGDSWTMKKNNFKAINLYNLSNSVYAMDVSENNPQIIYAGLGVELGFGDNYPAGSTLGYVYKSTNGGDNWTEININNGAIADQSIMSIKIDPDNDNKIYLLSQKKFFKSIDAGVSWQEYALPYSDCIYTSLAIKKNNPEYLLISYVKRGGSETGIIRNTNNGAAGSWTNEFSYTYTMTDKERGIVQLKLHPTLSYRFFAVFYRDTDNGVKTSSDNGDTWSASKINSSVSQDSSVWLGWAENATAFSVDPKNINRMCYVNDMEVYQTTDAGNEWDQIASYRSSTNNAHYITSGLEILVASSLTINPYNPEMLIMGYLDVNLFASDDGGESLFEHNDTAYPIYGDVCNIVADPANPNNIYITRGNTEDTQSLYFSNDHGESFTQMTTWSNVTNAAITALIIDPTTTATTVYVATKTGVYYTTDNGVSWSTKNTGLPTANKTIFAMALHTASNNDKILYIGARAYGSESGYVAKSINNNDWSVVLGVDANGTIQNSKVDIRSVAVDPSDPNIVYAGHRDYSGYSLDKILWRSENSGATWSYVSGSQFNVAPFDQATPRRYYMKTIVPDPSRPGFVYAGLTTESYIHGGGIFYSDDYGVNWQPFDSTGLLSYRISNIIIDPVNTARIYAATSGGGFLRYGIPPEFDLASANPYAHWKFDSNADDAVGDNNGIISGTPTWTDGQKGNAIELANSDESISCGTASELNIGTGSYTLNTWIYPDNLFNVDGSNTNKEILFAKYQDSDNRFFLRFYNADYVQFYATVGGIGYNVYFYDSDFTGKGSFIQGQWHMLTLTVNRTDNKISLYRNGNLIAAKYIDISNVDISNSGQFHIGSQTGNSSSSYYNFAGKIDDMQIFKSSLPADEIKNLCQLQYSFWKFESNTDDAMASNLATKIGTTIWTTGHNGNDLSIYFNTIDDSVACGNNDDFNIGSEEYSINTWIYPYNLVNYVSGGTLNNEVLFAKYEDWDNRFFLRFHNADYIQFYATVGGIGNSVYFDASDFVGKGSFSSYQWHMLTLTINRTDHTVSLYRNGNLIAAKTLNLSNVDVSNSGTFRIGSQTGTSSSSYPNLKARIDEFRVFKYSLDQARITELLSE